MWKRKLQAAEKSTIQGQHAMHITTMAAFFFFDANLSF